MYQSFIFDIENMNKKMLMLLIVMIFLSANISTASISKQSSERHLMQESNNSVIYVDDDNTQGPWNGSEEYPYQHINDGVKNATEGNTIYVFSGTYNETLIIDKQLIIKGENKTNTIIDGMHGETVVDITEDYVNIINFTIRNSGGFMHNSGIEINSNNNSISDCVLYRTKTGIYVNNTTHNKIKNCIFHTNGEGVYLKSAASINIEECNIFHNAIGIYIKDSNEAEISDSYAYTNGIGVFLNGSSNIEITHSAFSDNNDNEGGVFIYGCFNVKVINCNICHNGVGLKISKSENISIEKCDIDWNTHYASKISGSEDVAISKCEIKHSFRFGIVVLESSCKINYNNFYRNAIYGLRSKSSFCNARRNWWGFITRPVFTGFRIADRINLDLGKFLFFPWYLRPLKNVGSDWKTNDVFTKINILYKVHKTIEFNETDTDDDGAPDWWEEKWGYNPNVWDDHINLDEDDDALNNIEECFADKWGSNPFEKDLFIEFDWIETQNPSITNKPPKDQIDLMKNAFEKHDINLHVDTGELGGGEELPYIAGFLYADLRDLYWNYFLHNDLNNPRKGIFHYGLICDYGTAGFAFIGWDHLDSFGIAAQTLVDSSPDHSRGGLIVTGSMHETGHTLGLLVDDFKGIDSWATTELKYKEFLIYNNYKSCMSYRYTWDIMDYSDGSHLIGDFDDWSSLDFNFFKNSHFEWPKE